jgi:hypothetical protein
MDKKISELASLILVQDTDLIPIVDTVIGETKKVTFGTLKSIFSEEYLPLTINSPKTVNKGANDLSFIGAGNISFLAKTTASLFLGTQGLRTGVIVTNDFFVDGNSVLTGTLSAPTINAEDISLTGKLKLNYLGSFSEPYIDEIVYSTADTPAGTGITGTGSDRKLASEKAIVSYITSTITPAYIREQISGSNGLTYNSTTGLMKLGGNITGYTAITNGTGGSLVLEALSSGSNIGLYSATNRVYIGNPNGVQFIANGNIGSDTNNAFITISATSGGLKISDLRSLPRGLQYTADYSAGFTTRSITDVGYVSSAISSAVSGLNIGSYQLTSQKNGANGYAGTDANSRLAVNVDAGRIIGVLDISNIPAGAKETVYNYTGLQILPENMGLTTANVQNGDIVRINNVSNANNLRMWLVVNDTALNNSNSYLEYSAGNAMTLQGNSSAYFTNPINILQTASHRFVTDAEKATWNSKEPAISVGSAGQYFKHDKTWGSLLTDVLNLVLTGYTVGTNIAISATDSFMTAFRNLQAQISALLVDKPHRILQASNGTYASRPSGATGVIWIGDAYPSGYDATKGDFWGDTIPPPATASEIHTQTTATVSITALNRTGRFGLEAFPYSGITYTYVLKQGASTIETRSRVSESQLTFTGLTHSTAYNVEITTHHKHFDSRVSILNVTTDSPPSYDDLLLAAGAKGLFHPSPTEAIGASYVSGLTSVPNLGSLGGNFSAIGAGIKVGAILENSGRKSVRLDTNVVGGEYYTLPFTQGDLLTFEQLAVCFVVKYNATNRGRVAGFNNTSGGTAFAEVGSANTSTFTRPWLRVTAISNVSVLGAIPSLTVFDGTTRYCFLKLAKSATQDSPATKTQFDYYFYSIDHAGTVRETLVSKGVEIPIANTMLLNQMAIGETSQRGGATMDITGVGFFYGTVANVPSDSILKSFKPAIMY